MSSDGNQLMKIGVFGLGEAGSLFAADLVAQGQQVAGYDPADVATPEGVERHCDPRETVSEADVVIALTASADATTALEQAFDQLPSGCVYADFSTGSAGLKQQLAATAERRHIAFVDVALLAVVPGKGLRTPALASGSGANAFCELFAPLGMPVDSLGPEAGDAATRKLLRSVFMKGLAAVTIEAMRGAEQAGLSQWLWENLSQEVAAADGALLHRLVTGTHTHARRRLHEMEAAEALLQELDVDPVMTRSTVENLKQVMTAGLPPLPADN
tara:strand:+ start:10368 stop:11183 length:816 start_codon:yes stop_codon:yes gene_type:complete